MVITKVVDLFEKKNFVSKHFCCVSYILAGKVNFDFYKNFVDK